MKISIEVSFIYLSSVNWRQTETDCRGNTCVKQVFFTWGLWDGVRSLSSCFCCCRWTRPCVWACWAIAFSFSGYNWASMARICHARKEIKAPVSNSRIELATRELSCPLCLVSLHIQTLPDLPASFWLSALSLAAALTQSSPSSSPQSFPPPECLVSRSLHLSPPHASSLGRSHLTPVDKTEICIRWPLKLIFEGQQTLIMALLGVSVLRLPVWFVWADCSAAVAVSSPAPK